MSPVIYRHGKRIEVDVVYPPGCTRRKRKDTFVMVPLAQAAAMAKATKTTKAMVWLTVLYEAWANKGKPFTLSNKKLAGFGVTPDTKGRALAEMEAAGLISVKRDGKRSPIVTWVDPHGRG